jgi:hypothetical protein
MTTVSLLDDDDKTVTTDYVSHVRLEDEEIFADRDALMKSMSPLLNNMRFFGIYFKQDSSVDADAPKSDSGRTYGKEMSGKAVHRSVNLGRLYAIFVLVLLWANIFRFITVFNSEDKFGSLLFTKVIAFGWNFLCTVLHTSYFVACHTGRLDRVLREIRVTPDLAKKIRSVATVVTVLIWIIYISSLGFSFYALFFTGGRFDFLLAPAVTQFAVSSETTLLSLKVIILLVTAFMQPALLFPHSNNLVLAAIFCQQFCDLNKKFRRAIDDCGQFHGNLEKFRHRHQALCRLVKMTDGFVMISNVAGFCCHILGIILILYAMIFYPFVFTDMLTTSMYVFWLLGNSVGLFEAVIAGILVNHTVTS